MASGEGRISGTPDKVSILVASVTEARDADGAARQSARVQSEVIAAAKTLVGTQGLVKTAAYGLTALYDFNNGKQTQRGYQVRSTIAIEMWDTKLVGAVIDATVKAGANEISSIEFGCRDTATLRQQAIKAASQAALREATAAAEALGMRLGQVRTVSVGASGGQAPVPMERLVGAGRMASTATPIEPGTVEVTAVVSVEAQLAKP